MVATFAILLLLGTAQAFPPGYVDPEPVLAAAEKAIGARLRCVTLSGTGFPEREGAWGVV